MSLLTYLCLLYFGSISFEGFHPSLPLFLTLYEPFQLSLSLTEFIGISHSPIPFLLARLPPLSASLYHTPNYTTALHLLSIFIFKGLSKTITFNEPNTLFLTIYRPHSTQIKIYHFLSYCTILHIEAMFYFLKYLSVSNLNIKYFVSKIST